MSCSPSFSNHRTKKIIILNDKHQNLLSFVPQIGLLCLSPNYSIRVRIGSSLQPTPQQYPLRCGVRLELSSEHSITQRDNTQIICRIIG